MSERKRDFADVTREFRSKVIAREKLFGIFVKSPDFASIEILGARTELNFIILDLEHSNFTFRELQSCILAARSYSLPVLIRVASSTSEYIGQSLDGGVSGIMFPRVATPDEAAKLVTRTRFGNGTRGFSLSHRAAGYGAMTQEQFLKYNDSGLLRAMQIEDVEGVANTESIARTNGVDLIFVGPADLAVSISANSPNLSDIESETAKIVDGTALADTAAGIFLPNLDNVEKYIGLGFTFFVVSTDQQILSAGVSSFATEFKKFT